MRDPILELNLVELFEILRAGRGHIETVRMKYCAVLGIAALLVGCGSGGSTSAGSSSNALKGVAYSTTGGECADLDQLGVSWYYNWSGSTKCSGSQFVPQIWGSWQKLDWVQTPAETVAHGATELLGFNEPDGSDQSNIPVDEALRLWPDMQQPGVLLGSPRPQRKPGKRTS